jgi:hypothetical protein
LAIIAERQCVSMETSFPAGSARRVWQVPQLPDPEKWLLANVVSGCPGCETTVGDTSVGDDVAVGGAAVGCGTDVGAGGVGDGAAWPSHDATTPTIKMMPARAINVIAGLFLNRPGLMFLPPCPAA